MCAMLRTKESSTDAKHTNVQEKEGSIVNAMQCLEERESLFLRE